MHRTDNQPELIVQERTSELFRREPEISMLDFVVLIAERKRFVIRFVLGAALLATVVAFVLPIRYEAKIVLLPPSQNSSIGSSLLGQLGSLGSLGSLATLAGGGLGLKNPADNTFLSLPAAPSKTQ